MLLRRNLPVLALERYRRLAEPGQFLGDFVQFFSRCQDELVTPDDYDRYVASLAERYARERARCRKTNGGCGRRRSASSRRLRGPTGRVTACCASATC